MKGFLYILSVVTLITTSCSTNNVVIEKLMFYDSSFKLPSNSLLRVDGFYQIEENFRTFLQSQDSFDTKITLGFIQFFDDGFCRVGNWNGIFSDKDQVFHTATSDSVWGWRWGLYKLSKDTIKIEYTRKWEKSITKTKFYRVEITGLLKADSILIIEDPPLEYSYPPDRTRSAQACIGKFVQSEINKKLFDNFLKREPDKYFEVKKTKP